MTANCKRNALAALLLVLCLLLSFSIVSVSADDEATDPEEVTEAVADTEADTDAATTAETTAETSAGTNAEPEKVDHTKGIINLCVGAVILIALIVLAIIFRKKIPVWFRNVKSECGKIVWCPADKLKKNTIVVVVIILAITVLIGILDFAFSKGLLLLSDLFH